MKVSFHYGKLECDQLNGIDVIVSPSDIYLSGIGGLDQVIHTMAGESVEQELKAFRPIQSGEAVQTSGGLIGCKYIIHAAVPNHTEDLTVLQKCYENILWEAARHDNNQKRMAITLIGTGACGWSVQESMEAFWQAMLRHQRAHGSSYFGFATISELVLYYLPEQHQQVYRYQKRRSQVFFETPEQWGTRGDPHFWYDLMFHFDHPKYNDLGVRELIHEIQRYFHRKSGEWLSESTKLYLEEYAHGGMTSGMISGFMAQIGIPLLCNNMIKLGMMDRTHGHFVIPVELYGIHPQPHRLKLPYDLLGELEFLRTPYHSMNEKYTVALDDAGENVLSVYHYKGDVTLIDRYVLKAASEICYELDEAGASKICNMMGYVASAFASALKSYRVDRGNGALEALLMPYAVKTYPKIKE